jgi:hypothetical protein
MSFADLILAADRAAQRSLGGVPVIYVPEAAPSTPVTVTGIFDANFVFVDQGNAGVEQVGPAVFLRLEDLPADPDVDDPRITIAGIVYAVRERQRDSLGGIRLLLHLADS